MKEIRILINNLKTYPPNYFVVPIIEEKTGTAGLAVYNMYGELQGLIETGKDVKSVLTR